MRANLAGLAIVCAFLGLACSAPGGPGTPSGGDPGGGTTPPPIASPKAFWGSWTRMDNGTGWYIADDRVESPGQRHPLTASSAARLTTADLVLDLQSDNLIKVTEGPAAYYLFRNGGATNSFTGRVVSAGGPGSRALGPAAGVNLVIRNALNVLDVHEATTDGNGVFAVSDAITDNIYLVDYGETAEAEVIPRADGDDVGIFTIAESGYKLKTTITSVHGFYVCGTEYDIVLSVKNHGDRDCPSASYRLEAGPGLEIRSGATEGILGTIEPGKAREITLTVYCGLVDGESDERAIGLTVTDAEGGVREDRVSLRFFRGWVLLKASVIAGGTANFAILSPEGKCWCFSYSKDFVLGLPYRAVGYTLAFSGAAADTEVTYGLGYEFGNLNLQPPTQAQLAAFTDTGSFEPNDGEASKVAVTPAQTLISYLGKNDIDFYLLDLAPKESLPDLVYTLEEEELPGFPARVVFSEDSGVLRYTSDGSEPTSISPLVPQSHYYRNAKTLFAYQSAIYKFKTFAQGFLPTRTLTLDLRSGWAEGMVPRDEIHSEWLGDGSGANTGSDGVVLAKLAPAASSYASDRFGRDGSAFAFQGTGDFLYAACGPGYRLSVSLWFKTTTASARIFGFGNAGAGGTSSTTDRVLYLDDGGLLRFGVLDGGQKRAVASSVAVNDGRWHHALVRMPVPLIDPYVEERWGGLELYLDGEVAGFMDTGDLSGTGAIVRLGYDALSGWPGVAAARSYEGLIDDVRVYSKPVSREEIAYIYKERP